MSLTIPELHLTPFAPPLEQFSHSCFHRSNQSLNPRLDLVDQPENCRVHLCPKFIDSIAQRLADASKPDLVGEKTYNNRHAAVHEVSEFRSDGLDGSSS